MSVPILMTWHWITNKPSILQMWTPKMSAPCITMHVQPYQSGLLGIFKNAFFSQCPPKNLYTAMAFQNNIMYVLYVHATYCIHAVSQCEGHTRPRGGNITSKTGWHIGQSKAWRKAEMAFCWKRLKNSGTVEVETYLWSDNEAVKQKMRAACNTFHIPTLLFIFDNLINSKCNFRQQLFIVNSIGEFQFQLMIVGTHKTTADQVWTWFYRSI